MTKQATSLEKLDKIPEEISLSKVPWIAPDPYVKENYDRKPEKDIHDEMALRADFTSHTPSLDVIKRRAQYRPQLWFNCIPRDQRFMIITTYGPEEQGYDIDSEKIGFEFFGCFETYEQVAEQIRYIREFNPHAAFITLHTIDVGTGKRIDFPPPNDGSGKNFHLNKQHQQIMQNHLRKAVKDAEYVENRVDESIMDLKRRNQIVRDYNKKIQSHAKNILGLNRDELKKKREESKNHLFQNLQLLDKESASANLPTNPRDKNVVQQVLGDVKSLTFDQVEDFITAQDNMMNLPVGYRTFYRRFTDENGKDYLVRAIQALE